MAGLLTSLAGCPDRLDLAIHLLGHNEGCVTSAFASKLYLYCCVVILDRRVAL